MKVPSRINQTSIRSDMIYIRVFTSVFNTTYTYYVKCPLCKHQLQYLLHIFLEIFTNLYIINLYPRGTLPIECIVKEVDILVVTLNRC